jgi:signal transduction histidine kinase
MTFFLYRFRAVRVRLLRMSGTSDQISSRKETLYGALAYTSVVLTCHVGYFHTQTYYTSEYMVPVVFVLGAIYAALGVLAVSHIDGRGRAAHAWYYGLQIAIVTAIVVLSPSRGFNGILVLPILSQAIFDLRVRNAVLVGIYLFGLNIAMWAVPYGWDGALRAFVSYIAAFAFTIVFTIMTKQAVVARKREGKLREEVEQANQLLREHALQTEDLATTRERNRVAREIHDGVGHYLTVVKTQLDAAVALLPEQPERAREAVTTAAKLTGDALDDVRRSVGALRTDAKRPPLPDALRALMQESRLPVTVRIEGAVRSLPSAIEHALYRAAQEGLTNIRKHATATAAEIALDFRAEDRVSLAVLDNGRGINGGAGSGFGLLGIRERIEVLGGRVESGNRSTGGFSLKIEVPA